MKNPNSAQSAAQNSALNSNAISPNLKAKPNSNAKPEFSPNVVLSARNLCKNYGAQVALKNVSFDLQKGEIFGLIGADGAGKSTLVRILSTLLLANSGECEILGLDIQKNYAKIRAKLGYMPATFSLYADLSVEENLQFFADIFAVNLEQNYPLIAPIYSALEPFSTRKAGALSGGMKQKLALCCALIHKPEILLLDEPSTGVDAVSRAEFWDILRKLKKQMSIIVSTPYMDEASLCDRVALMAQGQFLRTDTPATICASFGASLFALYHLPIHLLENLRNLSQIKSAFLFGESCHIVLNSAFDKNLSQENLEQFLREKLGCKNLRVKRIEPSIEDCFMEFLR